MHVMRLIVILDLFWGDWPQYLQLSTNQVRAERPSLLIIRQVPFEGQNNMGGKQDINLAKIRV